MIPHAFTPDEVNALIADRHGNRVYSRTAEDHEDFYLKRDGEELRPADYSTNPTYLQGERAAGVFPDDPTGRELYEQGLKVTPLTAYGQAMAFVDAFIPDPRGRLEIIRQRVVQD